MAEAAGGAAPLAEPDKERPKDKDKERGLKPAAASVASASASGAATVHVERGVDWTGPITVRCHAAPARFAAAQLCVTRRVTRRDGANRCVRSSVCICVRV